MAKVGRSVIHSTIANLGSIGMSIAIVIIVSRLLPPQMVGVFVMAFAVVFFIDQLREFQLPSWVAQLTVINRDTIAPVRFMAFVTTGLAIAACLISALLFHFIADRGEVARCIAIMAAGLILRPWSQPAMAILQRDMRYGSVAAIRLLASVIRLAITVGLIVFADLGAEALAWGVVAEFSAEFAAIALVKPELRNVAPGKQGLSNLVRFCAQYTAATTLIQIAVAIAPLLIGGYHGFAMAALYNRGTAVTRLLRSGVERAVLLIAMTQFAQLREDLTRLRARYLASLGMLTSVSWPALALFVLLAHPVVLILFGPAWRGTAPLAQFLGLGAMIHAGTALSHQVHAAVGNTARIMRREIADQGMIVAVVVATAPFGALPLVKAMLAASFVSYGLHYALLRREIGMRVSEYIAAVSRSVTLTIGTLVGTSLVLVMLKAMPRNLWELTLVVAGGGAGWIAMALAVRSPLLAEFRALFASTGHRSV